MIFIKYHDEKNCNVNYLAKEFNVTKPTISDAVRVLYNKEYLQKNYSIVDKRDYILILTKAGQLLVEQTENFAQPLSQIVEKQEETTLAKGFDFLNTTISELHQTGLISIQKNCHSYKYFRKDGQQF